MTFTWNKAKRRCGKCSTDVPNAVKGWSMHPVYRMICPDCTNKRKAANAVPQVQQPRVEA